MTVQELIEKYEARLANLRVDQRTDDAMHPVAYQAVCDTLNRVIEDLNQLK